MDDDGLIIINRIKRRSDDRRMGDDGWIIIINRMERGSDDSSISVMD